MAPRRHHLASLVVVLVWAACASACSSEDSAAPAQTGGQGGSEASAPIPRAKPGEPCDEPEDCVCIECTCGPVGAIAEACNTQQFVCAGPYDLCEYACQQVKLSGQPQDWTGAAREVECPAYRALDARPLGPSLRALLVPVPSSPL